MPKKSFRLADVDGTVPGVAIMTIVSIDPATPEDKILLSVDRIIEADDRPNPGQFANALWESTKGDWPKHKATFALNERATYLLMNSRNNAILGDTVGMSPREYWENYA